jgi:glutamyl-tRNA synthetase
MINDETELHNMSVRVRFAPSPTGFLHIGGARTALFNWLYARHTQGTFILRIEDTDSARNTQEAVDVILNGLRWLGLDWDEGPLTGAATGPCQGQHGPYFQSQRKDIYRKRVAELMDKGMAYDVDGAVKFRMTRDPITIHDWVAGEITRPLNEDEQKDPDFVIVRSDGQPVFHLVNVVDDLEMRITHVIRGEDHLSNTAKHIALFQALGVEPPKYAHIPLILNQDSTKMSKRDQGASLMTYRDEGYAPEAVLNFLCLLGWSPKGNREMMAVPEVIERFDLPQILRHNARFDLTKLQWMNGEYIRGVTVDRYVELGQQALRTAGLDLSHFDAGYIQAALLTCREKIKFLTELKDWADFYFAETISLAGAAPFTPETRAHLTRLKAALLDLARFDADAIGSAFKSLATELGIKAGALVHPVRLACTGKKIGPSLYHLIEVLGRDRVLARIDHALATL